VTEVVVARAPGSRQWWRGRTLGGLGLITLTLLAGCSGGHGSTAATLPTHRIESRIVLNTTHVVAGQDINGVLVVNNPGPSINLTTIARCRPTFAIYLSNRRINNQPVIPLDCSPRPFVIAHGTSRLRFTIRTRYSTCGRGPGRGEPKCLPDAAVLFPPLPRGSYQAMETLLPMPDPKPVAVTLIG
jgi:hypothetical protein